MQKNRNAKQPQTAIEPEENKDFPLLRNNFILMGISIALIILGFILISGGYSGLEEFNPEMFSTRRIVVGPFICFIGFVMMAVAIMVKPKEKE